jgi:hypothetical protein
MSTTQKDTFLILGLLLVVGALFYIDGMFGIVGSFVAVSLFNLLKASGLERARELLRKQGTLSLHDYLFIFPDACPKCGSRDLEVFSWEGTSQGDIGASALIVLTLGRESKCLKCGNEFQWGDKYSGPQGESYCEKRSIIRVKSPYLSDEEANGISDFTCQDLQS